MELRIWRLSNGYTIQEVADRIGIARNTYVGIENNRERAGPETVKKIEDLTGGKVTEKDVTKAYRREGLLVRKKRDYAYTTR